MVRTDLLLFRSFRSGSEAQGPTSETQDPTSLWGRGLDVWETGIVWPFRGAVGAQAHTSSGVEVALAWQAAGWVEPSDEFKQPSHWSALVGSVALSVRTCVTL